MLNRFNVGGQGIVFRSELELSKSELNEAFAEASKAGKDFGLTLSSNVCTPLCIVEPKDFPNIIFTFCSSDVKTPFDFGYEGELKILQSLAGSFGKYFQ